MKTLDIAQFSSQYAVRRLTEADVPIVLELCLTNPQFYEYCEATPSTEQILSDLSLTPPGKDLSDKYYVGLFDGNRLIAALDLIDGYPDDVTAFIGFFMMAGGLQGRGLGSRIISELCAYLQSVGFTKVRLGIDKLNPQSTHFWKKNGFQVLREVPRGDWTVLLAERVLTL